MQVFLFEMNFIKMLYSPYENLCYEMQSGANVKQAFLDADESMKQSMEDDTGIPGTTSLNRTNTPSFDQFC